jgi:hypothetical protein
MGRKTGAPLLRREHGNETPRCLHRPGAWPGRLAGRGLAVLAAGPALPRTSQGGALGLQPSSEGRRQRAHRGRHLREAGIPHQARGDDGRRQLPLAHRRRFRRLAPELGAQPRRADGERRRHRRDEPLAFQRPQQFPHPQGDRGRRPSAWDDGPREGDRAVAAPDHAPLPRQHERRRGRRAPSRSSTSTATRPAATIPSAWPGSGARRASRCARHGWWGTA